MTATITHARNATLGDLAEILKSQQASKLDIVAPATTIRSVEGNLVVRGAEAILDENGVTTTDGIYRPTAVCDEGLADKLNIPLAYLRRLREGRVDLFDANVNGWLTGRNAKYALKDGEHVLVKERIDPDGRSFLLRCFRDEDGGVGVGRAFLSDRYATLDNLDALTAALDGVRQSGVEAQIVSCDLTERRMTVKIAAPGVAVQAPELLRGYRNQFSDPQVASMRLGQPVDFGYGAVDSPLVFAGFVLSNSETGGGAFTIVPRLVVKVCNNGMTVTKDAMRQVHLGSKLEEGVVRWAADTQSKNAELVTLKARDAVREFLSADYVQRTVDRIEAQADSRVTKPADAIKFVGKKLAYSEEQIAGVLDFFLLGGQATAGGVLNAITAYAQTVEDADEAFAMESTALRALELAAAL